MKSKLMITLTMMGIMLIIIGCKPDKIEDEAAINEAIATLTSNDWESVYAHANGTGGSIVKRKLHFTNRSVTLSLELSLEHTTTFSKHEGTYEISKNGKTISITIKSEVYTLNYSKDKLTGFWDNTDVEFKIISSTGQIPWDGTAVSWTKGTGTITSPYLIETAKHLAYLAQETNKGKSYIGTYFRLINHLNLGGYSRIKWVPIGINENYPFSGNFDGNGKTIADMYINLSFGDDDYAGLFGYATGGEIKSIGIVGGSSVTTISDYAGGIAGYSESPIINCYNTGNVKSNSVGYWSTAGGIAGFASRITNCYNTGNISGSITNKSHQLAKVGGIAGSSEIINNCYNTGNVSSSVYKVGESTAFAGGISGNGYTGSRLENCYNVGTVDAYAYPGSTCRASGICGDESYARVSNCYTLNNMVSINSASRDNGNNRDGMVKTLGEMRNSSFVNLLNDGQSSTAWLMDKMPSTNQGYPILLSHEIVY